VKAAIEPGLDGLLIARFHDQGIALQWARQTLVQTLSGRPTAGSIPI